MDDYIFEATKQWYDDPGVAYRRGFLLSGLSESDKSSLALPVATHFNLDVYMLSLHNEELDDTRLARCLLAVPERCMLLIEDIDAAFDWDCDLEEEDIETPGTNRASSTTIDARMKKGADANKSSVSLTGLLNAIDRPVAPEGHVLFMTTNCSKTLNPALIRPGRVDVRIDSKYADKIQIEDIFMFMYKPRNQTANSKEYSKSETKPELTAEEVSTFAKSFAQNVSEYVFSLLSCKTTSCCTRRSPRMHSMDLMHG
jgi:mitochondrial chaperone BCS1